MNSMLQITTAGYVCIGVAIAIILVVGIFLLVNKKKKK